MHPFCESMLLQPLSTVQDACSGSDSRTGIPVRRTPARAADALRLGLRWLAHQPRDARTLYKMPEPAGSRTSGEQLGPPRGKLESQAWTPAGPANALRLALRRPGHGEPNARALHHMPEAAGGLRRRGPTRGTLKVKRGRPAGPRMKCGWGCGFWLTARATNVARNGAGYWTGAEGSTPKQ
jgi:hypothetical protein